MKNKKQAQRDLVLLALTSFFVILCYYFFDKPIAYWIAQYDLRSTKVFKPLSHLPEVFFVAAIISYFVFMVRFYLNRITAFDLRLLTFGYGIAITYFLKDFFKYIFGRYWPETWIANNPSLIKDNAYGFHFFHSGIKFGAFPSGHTALLLAGISLLWLFYPKWWPLYVIFILASLIGIIALNYHFLSDLIAGGFLGYIVGTYTAAIFKSEKSFIREKLTLSDP